MRIVLEESAEADIASAYAWYKSHGKDLHRQFSLSIERMLQHISDYPQMHPVVGKRLRRASIPKFPYGIFYMCDDATIRIFAVIHTSRSPKVWKSREH